MHRYTCAHSLFFWRQRKRPMIERTVKFVQKKKNLETFFGWFLIPFNVWSSSFSFFFLCTLQDFKSNRKQVSMGNGKSRTAAPETSCSVILWNSNDRKNFFIFWIVTDSTKPKETKTFVPVEDFTGENVEDPNSTTAIIESAENFEFETVRSMIEGKNFLFTT